MGQLFDIRGNAIQAAVQRTVSARLPTSRRGGSTGPLPTSVGYAVCSRLRKPVISPGKLVEDGAITHLEKGEQLDEAVCDVHDCGPH